MYLINIWTILSIRDCPSILDLRGVDQFFAGALYQVGCVRAVKVNYL